MKGIIKALLTTYINELNIKAGNDESMIYISDVQIRIEQILEYVMDISEMEDEKCFTKSQEE